MGFHLNIGILSWRYRYGLVAQGTIWSHTVMFGLVIFGTVMVLGEEMLLAVRQFTMLAFER